MLALRSVIAVGLILMGAWVIVRMIPFPFAQGFTGWVLGGAMIALGVLRLRQIGAIRRGGR
jgi:hypothetical protein